VASFNLLSRVQRFIVFVSQPECLADLFHHVLIGGRRGASNRFVSDVGSCPVGVNVSSRQLGRARVVLAKLAFQQVCARSETLRLLELSLDLFVRLILIALSPAGVYEFFLCLLSHDHSSFALPILEKSLSHNE